MAWVEEGEGHHPMGNQEASIHSHRKYCGGKEQSGGGGEHGEGQVGSCRAKWGARLGKEMGKVGSKVGRKVGRKVVGGPPEVTEG